MPFGLPPSLLHRRVREGEEDRDKVYEAVCAIVVDNRDPRDLARVKLRFPTLPGDDVSHWATLSSQGAGKEQGWCFIPEVNDEVLVMFEHGDIRRPVVIGALWNEKDPPCETNDGSNERRTLVSRSGSRVCFDDSKGVISIEDAKRKSRVIVSSDGIRYESDEGDVCLVAPSGKLEVAAKTIKAKADERIRIHSGKRIRVESGANARVGSPLTLVFQGGSTSFNSGGVDRANTAKAKPGKIDDPIGD